jgi:hypothetical protein
VFALGTFHYGEFVALAIIFKCCLVGH